MDKERGDLCKKFENACVYLKKRSEYKNRILENKLDQLREEFEKKVQLYSLLLIGSPLTADN